MALGHRKFQAKNSAYDEFPHTSSEEDYYLHQGRPLPTVPQSNNYMALSKHSRESTYISRNVDLSPGHSSGKVFWTGGKHSVVENGKVQQVGNAGSNAHYESIEEYRRNDEQDKMTKGSSGYLDMIDHVDNNRAAECDGNYLDSTEDDDAKAVECDVRACGDNFLAPEGRQRAETDYVISDLEGRPRAETDYVISDLEGRPRAETDYVIPDLDCEPRYSPAPTRK